VVTDETLLAVREALKTQFRKAVEGSSGEAFEATKVSMPQDFVWDAYASAALTAALPLIRGAVVEVGKFKVGDRVTKTKGSSWTGLVVGFYSTTLTPEGYAVESETEKGSVQIYPAAALALSPREAGE
jgi:hypothetical protein